MDLSALHISSPPSPQDGRFASSASTPSLSNTSNPPSTPQDSIRSFSSFSSDSKPTDDDPNVWINPTLKSPANRFSSSPSNQLLDEVRFSERPQGFREPVSIHEPEFHHRGAHGGLFGNGMREDDWAQIAASRRYVPGGESPLTPQGLGGFADSRDNMGRGPLGLFGLGGNGGGRAQTEASMYNLGSPYSQGRPELTPSPAGLSAHLPSANEFYSTSPSTFTGPPSRSAFPSSTSFSQMPQSIASPTPRPPLGGALFAGPNPHVEGYNDLSLQLHMESLTQQPFPHSSAFESYIQAHGQFPPHHSSFPSSHGSPQHQQHERPPVSTHHEVSLSHRHTRILLLISDAP